MNINVTKPFLPPIDEYQSYIQSIWSRQWLTNHGPLVNELEEELANYLQVNRLLYVSNGTIALQLAIKALGLTGEIITTPFSYIATTSSILWEGCHPVMVDIDPHTLNIDADKIEAAITERTTAILATHVYGNACDIEQIAHIAEKHQLKVIYDAAHAFGTQFQGRSVLSYGDVSTISFHATKLFHTIEGGGLVCSQPKVIEQLERMRNFGHTSPTDFSCVGINGKNSEVHAAMGLCNLKYINDIRRVRAELSAHYDALLKELPLQKPRVTKGCAYNYAYYPIILSSESVLHQVLAKLNQHQVFPRRYFYPSLSQLSFIEGNFSTPLANDIASRVLCLPLYHTLSQEEINMICRLIRGAFKEQ